MHHFESFYQRYQSDFCPGQPEYSKFALEFNQKISERAEIGLSVFSDFLKYFHGQNNCKPRDWPGDFCDFRDDENFRV
jgi:hypothetical protein